MLSTTIKLKEPFVIVFQNIRSYERIKKKTLWGYTSIRIVYVLCKKKCVSENGVEKISETTLTYLRSLTRTCENRIPIFARPDIVQVVFQQKYKSFILMLINARPMPGKRLEIVETLCK